MISLFRQAITLAGALLLCIGSHVTLGFTTGRIHQQQKQFLSSSTWRFNAASALPLDTIVPPTPLEAEETKVGVLLLNLGGPETGDDVEGL